MSNRPNHSALRHTAIFTPNLRTLPNSCPHFLGLLPHRPHLPLAMQLLQTSGRSKANSPIIVNSFTPLIHLLVRTHATFCVPGTRCQCFISWNCKMPGVEKDFIDILVQPPGFHDEETDLAWLEDFSKFQRLVLLTSYLEFLAWF